MDWWDDWSGWSNFGDTPAPEDDPLVLPTVTVVGSRIEEFGKRCLTATASPGCLCGLCC